MTIFREEFGTFFISMFATLVFIKVLHWLVQDRVDYAEVTPSVSRLQHVRLVAFMSALLVSSSDTPFMSALLVSSSDTPFMFAPLVSSSDTPSPQDAARVHRSVDVF